MPRYNVYLVAVASTQVEVEAEDGEQAVELAFQQDLPYAPGFANYDFGEWTTSSELFQGDPQDDWEEIA